MAMPRKQSRSGALRFTRRPGRPIVARHPGISQTMSQTAADMTAPRRKLPARYGALVTPLLISVLMSCIVSDISTLNGVGLIDGFIELWMHAWGTSWIVAFPILIIVLPIVRRIVGTVVEQPAR